MDHHLFLCLAVLRYRRYPQVYRRHRKVYSIPPDLWDHRHHCSTCHGCCNPASSQCFLHWQCAVLGSFSLHSATYQFRDPRLSSSRHSAPGPRWGPTVQHSKLKLLAQIPQFHQHQVHRLHPHLLKLLWTLPWPLHKLALQECPALPSVYSPRPVCQLMLEYQRRYGGRFGT